MVRIGPAFLDNVSKSNIKSHRGRSRFSDSEFFALAPLFVLIIAFIFLGARIFYLQILRFDYYKALADSNRTRTELIQAPRGVILDRSGKPLVANSPAYKIIENKKVKPITNDEALKLISQGKKVENDIRRNYLYKSAFAHVIGYVGQISPDQVLMPEYENYGLNDWVGKIGLEREYEQALHGVNGKKLFEVDSAGKFVRQLGEDQPIPGKNLNTTLDLDIQLSVADAMKDVKKGAAVVSDPKTGGILALYSVPAFDANMFTYPSTYKPQGNYSDVQAVLSDIDNQPLLDRAVGGAYPPGSTFKLVVAAAALETGAIKPDTKIDDTGIIKAGASSFGNWYFLQYGRTEGLIDVVDSIKRSNDIFFYKAAESAGVDTISQWAKKFEFGKTLGIDLPQEVSGTVPTKEWKQDQVGEPWYLGDTYNYGIGQGYLLATPLQVNMMTDYFANLGTLYKPHLLQGQEKVVAKNFIKQDYVNLVRKGMTEACETGGVAYTFFNFKVKNPNIKIDDIDYFHDASAGAEMVHVPVACKTGTAEVGGDHDPHAWITVFAPIHNPEIAVTVFVENGGEGSKVAGPIATKIIKDYFEKK